MRDNETCQKALELEDAKKTEKKAKVKIRKGKMLKILETLFTGGNIEEAPDSNRSNKSAEHQLAPNEEGSESPALKAVIVGQADIIYSPQKISKLTIGVNKTAEIDIGTQSENYD